MVNRVCQLKFSTAFFVLNMLLLPSISFTEEVLPAVREYQVKAVFLFNFSKFTEWPSSVFPTPTSPISVCILGDDPFLGRLDIILKGNTSQGRSALIRYLQSVETAKDCHVLFVGNSEQGNLTAIFSFIRAYPVLTVSEIRDFVRHGGMIEFYNRESKVRFFVDPRTVKESGLQISSRLLQVADIVN